MVELNLLVAEVLLDLMVLVEMEPTHQQVSQLLAELVMQLMAEQVARQQAHLAARELNMVLMVLAVAAVETV
jgi:hypothetical protein